MTYNGIDVGFWVEDGLTYYKVDTSDMAVDFVELPAVKGMRRNQKYNYYTKRANSYSRQMDMIAIAKAYLSLNN